MLKSVKALVKIINEIWDNCKGRFTSSENDESPFTFKREVFEEVKVEKKGRHLIITTKLEKNMKDFGNLPSVPEDLKDLININTTESDILPDYNRYLEKSSILCKEVLLPFLTSFQEHLKEIQVFLGKIEEWLIEPEVVDSFLNKTFDIKLADVTFGYIKVLYLSYCLDVDLHMTCNYNLCAEDGRKRFEAALAFLKTYQPISQIVVKDAGEKAANGTYTMEKARDGNYYYTRSGVWDGKRVKFYLVRHKYKKRWCLTCDDENQYDGWVIFYWTKVTEDKGELPPMNGWDNASRGIDPPPQILYKVDD